MYETIVADWNQTSDGSVTSVCDLWLPLCSVVVRRRHGHPVVGSWRLAWGGHTHVNGKTKPPHLSDRPLVDSRCVSKPCIFSGVPTEVKLEQSLWFLSLPSWHIQQWQKCQRTSGGGSSLSRILSLMCTGWAKRAEYWALRNPPPAADHHIRTTVTKPHTLCSDQWNVGGSFTFPQHSEDEHLPLWLQFWCTRVTSVCSEPNLMSSSSVSYDRMKYETILNNKE